MKVLLVTTSIAGLLSIVFTACAPGQSAAYIGQPAPSAQPLYNALTPEDAYRTGQIDRWQLQQLTGPTPQALQGPSPNTNKGGEPQ